MSARHGLQTNRFEYKYLISESTAHTVRDYLRAHMVPDAFSAELEAIGYPVHTLYCDSPGLSLCRSTMQGHKNRFKLRIRFYDESPESPAFFEIKRRSNDAIMKERAAVHRNSVERLVNGHWPVRSDLARPSPREWDTIQRFCRWHNDLSGRGQVFVSYRREAFFSPEDNSVRVTFDRQLRGARYPGQFSLKAVDTWTSADVRGVILEFKFTTRFPDWLGDMARIFNLQRCSMPKYVECVEALDPASLPRVLSGRWSVA